MFFFNELDVGTEIMFHADEVNSQSKSLGVGSGPRRLICAGPDATICLVAPPDPRPPKGLRDWFQSRTRRWHMHGKATKSL